MRKIIAATLVLFGSSLGYCASFQDLMVIAHNPQFQDRVKYAMQKASVDIMAEDPLTAGHAARLSFATQILRGTASSEQYSVGVVTNGTVANEASLGAAGYAVPDSDIQFVVNSEFNAFAGIGN